MAHSCRYFANKFVASKLFLGVLLLLCGCIIYLLFRSKTINIYQWCSALGLTDTIDKLRFSVQDWNVSSFVMYSLPDGLYCAAYILITSAIWHNENSNIKYFIVLLMPFIAITNEVFQFFGLAKGTFDICDLACYFTPTLFFFLSQSTNNKMFNQLKQKEV